MLHTDRRAEVKHINRLTHRPFVRTAESDSCSSSAGKRKSYFFANPKHSSCKVKKKKKVSPIDELYSLFASASKKSYYNNNNTTTPI